MSAYKSELAKGVIKLNSAPSLPSRGDNCLFNRYILWRNEENIYPSHLHGLLDLYMHRKDYDLQIHKYADELPDNYIVYAP